MRILEIISGCGVDGVATHCRELSHALAARGHDVTLLCRPGAWIAKQVDAKRVAIERSTLKRNFAELKRVAAWVREQQFDVMHTHQSSAHFFGVILRYLAGRPVVATAQATHFQPHFWFNDHVIAVSEATARYHRRINRVPRDRISVAHNFVNVDDYADARSADGAAVRRELGINGQSPVILVVGTVGPRKNQAELVGILGRLASRAPDARLVLVGDVVPSYKPVVDAAAQKHGVGSRLIYAGRRTDVSRLLSAADVLALTSRSECLPMAIIEAMAAAKPVVAYAVGGIGEMIDDGRTGFAMLFGDEAMFTRRLEQVLTDGRLRHRLGVAGLDRARRHYCVTSEAPRIEAILANAASAALPPTQAAPLAAASRRQAA